MSLGTLTWNQNAVIAENLQQYHPPAKSRKRTNVYEWGGIMLGAAGLITRTWTQKEQRVLLLNFDPTYPMAIHQDVASIYPQTSDYFTHWGHLDLSGYLSELRNTFRTIRSSKFRLSVTIYGWYEDENGDLWQAWYTVKSTVYCPWWVRASDAARQAFYATLRKPGSYYTEFTPDDKREYVKRGRTSRRRAPAVKRVYDNPPDLYWLTVYAAWYGMEKVIEQLQDSGGRNYLDRKTVLFFNMDEVAMVMIEEYEEPCAVSWGETVRQLNIAK